MPSILANTERSRLIIAGGGKGGELSLTANRYRVSSRGDGNVLESDSGNGCTTL